MSVCVSVCVCLYFIVWQLTGVQKRYQNISNGEVKSGIFTGVQHGPKRCGKRMPQGKLYKTECISGSVLSVTHIKGLKR